LPVTEWPRRINSAIKGCPIAPLAPAPKIFMRISPDSADWIPESRKGRWPGFFDSVERKTAVVREWSENLRDRRKGYLE
jgi:hypothetical protein